MAIKIPLFSDFPHCSFPLFHFSGSVVLLNLRTLCVCALFFWSMAPFPSMYIYSHIHTLLVCVDTTTTSHLYESFLKCCRLKLLKNLSFVFSFTGM